MNIIEKATKFDKQELQNFLLIIIISGFILSFRTWGTTRFNLQIGIQNLIIYTLFFALFYIIFVSSQKIIAYILGYSSKFNLWQPGPMIGFLITFMTYGYLPFLYMGSIDIKTIPRLRIGNLRKGTNFKDLMLVGLAGPIISFLIVLLILEPLYFITKLEIIRTAIAVVSFIIFYTTLPLPNSNGANILLYSKFIWLLVFVFSIISIGLILLVNIYSYILALFLTLIVSFILYRSINN